MNSLSVSGGGRWEEFSGLLEGKKKKKKKILNEKRKEKMEEKKKGGGGGVGGLWRDF